MFRPEHKFLWMVVIFLAAATPLWGYYDLDNVPQGPPPNYNQIDSAYFMGGPSFASMSATQVGAYYIFKDAATNRWNIVSLVWPGGSLFEQLHGSVLVQMDRQPEE